jgi:UDP-N-acetylglucosamine acyltransferase
MIDAWARVDEKATIGDDVSVGPFAVIGPDVTIGDGCEIGPGAVVTGHTTLGRENVVQSHAVLGGPPQDLKYRGEPTRLVVGDGNLIREGVTMNVGTVGGGGITRVGDGNLIMAYAHVAHDCRVGDGVILSNNIMLAGHVVVNDGAILNGGAAAHHFTTIGRLSYVGGLSRLVQDVPPFVIAEGHPLRFGGVNVVGLRRRGVSEDAIRALRDAYRRCLRTDEPRTRVLAGMRTEWEGLDPMVREFVEALERQAAGKHGRSLEATRGQE